MEERQDLISRQAAIDAICKDGTRIERQGRYSMTMVERKQRDVDILENLPSAQTERKKGKWIERNPRNSPDCRLIECSECGNAYIVGYNINYDDWIDGRNFCMKCGADLRGGSNGKST